MTEVLAVQMATITCKCGGVYQINEAFRARCYDTSSSWTCPYCGTGWGYKGTGRSAQLEREKAELESKLRTEKWRSEQAEAAKLKAQLKAARLEAERKRERIRIHNGVCPCCNRTFTSLARHMAMKHPEYKL